MATVHTHRAAALFRGHAEPGAVTHAAPSPWWWLLGGAALFFAVPFVGADLLGLQPDLYYVGYATVAVAWFAAFAATYRDNLRALWRLNWPWSLGVGALVGVGVVMSILGSDSTSHPDGWRWWFEIGWRGLVYGSVDALTLFVFPAAVAFLLMHGNRKGVGRKLGYAGLVLALSLLVSTAYHLGYPEYRDSDLRSPLIGTVMADSSAVLTGNPIGAFLTHDAAHVTSVVHQEQGGPTKMLPPQDTGDYPSRGSQDLAVALATVWVLTAAGLGVWAVRRRRTP